MGRNTASFVILRDGQRKARRTNSYRTRTALASGLAATVLLATSAAAQDTRGGDGGLGNVMPGPPGGASSTTGTGGAGGNATESYEGGAGGGAGRVGGQGGNTSTGITDRKSVV